MSGAWALAAVFWGALTFGFSGAVPPGPMFAATVLHARRRGWTAGLLVSSGHASLELVLLAAIALGAGGALAHAAVARTVSVAGGLFLIAMGLATLLRPPLAETRGPEEGLRSGRWGALLAGVWTSISQPYWYLWWVTVGPSAVVYATRVAGPPGVGAFYVGHVLADYVWFTFVAATVGAGRSRLSDGHMGILIRACGLVLSGFGAAFLVVGLLYPHHLGGGNP